MEPTIAKAIIPYCDKEAASVQNTPSKAFGVAGAGFTSDMF